MVAVQAAKSLLSKLLATSGKSEDGPLLVVTAGPSLEEVTRDHPIMTLLDSCTSDAPTERIVQPYLALVSSLSAAGVCLATLCDALAKRWPGREIVLVVDEIILVESDHFFSNLDNISGTNSIRLILVLNPRFSTTMDEFYDEFNGPKALLVKQKCKCDAARKSKALDPPQQRSIFQDLSEESFQRVSLQTSYRSTKSIIKLARHLSKCLKKTFATDSDSDGLGSDLEGTKPMFFDTGRCDPSDLQSSILRLRYALETAEKELGSEVTILYNISGYAELQKMVKMMSRKEGPWCYKAAEFYGCEADKVFLLIFFFTLIKCSIVLKVVAVVSGFSILEMITRARTSLIVILIDNGDGYTYTDHKDYFSRAVKEDLLDEVKIPLNLTGQPAQVHV